MAGAGGTGGRGGAGGLQPLRATVPFQLQQRRGDGGRAASVPCAAAAAAEKSGRPRQPRVWRTSSLDTILGSYLLGQWPRDTEGAATSCMNDKATQVLKPVLKEEASVIPVTQQCCLKQLLFLQQPLGRSLKLLREELFSGPCTSWQPVAEDGGGKSHPKPPPEMASSSDTRTPVSWREVEAGRGGPGAHKRSASWSSTDHRREIAKLKQQLQRTKLNGRSGKEKEKSSPLQGDHAVLGSLRDSPSGFLSPALILRLSPCLHRSLEGLNEELEEVFVKEQGDEELLRILDVPDGHRAPAPAQRGSEDVSLTLEASSSCSSLSLSPSPSVPLHHSPHPPMRGAAEEQPDPKEKEECSPSPVLAFASSPRPNHSYVFKREPPEGCEKVLAFEEASSPSPAQPFQPSCPDKNKVHFNPTGSAFCPVSLVKPLFPNVGFLFRGFPASSSPATGTFTSCQPTSSPSFLGVRKDAAVESFSEVSKSSSLSYEHWKRGQAEENVVFHSSLVV